MSEYLNFDDRGRASFTYPMSPEQKVHGNPYNTTVFLHGFEWRGADHIFTELREEGDQAVGAFLWRIVSGSFMEGGFDTFTEELSEAEFDVAYSEEPTEQDRALFEKYVDNVVANSNLEELDEWWEHLGVPNE